MKYFFILNPGSRSGKSQKLFRKIFTILNAKKIHYAYAITANLEESYSLSKQANIHGYNVIVAVGGDGTINKVLNGFYADNGRRISTAKMGVLYTGTSPDFCKSYAIPYKNLEQSLDVLCAGRSIKIPIGKIIRAKEDPQVINQQHTEAVNNGVAFFACCVNIGIGASIARYANGGLRKYLGDSIGTFIALLKSIFNYTANDFTVKLDGREQVLSRLLNVSIGRTRYIASGIQVNNRLGIDDPGFYLFIAQNLRMRHIPRLLKTIYSGAPIINSEICSIQYCDKIEINANEHNPEVEFDGDPQGFLPCSIELAADKLELIVEQHDA